MAKPLEIEGFVNDTAGEDVFERSQQRQLEEQVYSLKERVKALEFDNARQHRIIKNLQTTLAPIHRALLALFGELELAVGEELPASPNGPVATAPASDPRWESFKKRFDGAGREIIDALLIHGEMGITHLAKLIGRHYDTTRKAAYNLRDAGAITLSNGKVSLRQ